MKKLFYILLISLTVTSCKKSGFLDPVVVGLSANDVFTDSLRTLSFLNGVYANVNYSFQKGRWASHGSTDIATDDAEYRYSGIQQYAVILYNGSISPSNVSYTPINVDFYAEPYAQIRACNLFLANITNAPFSASTKSRLTGEARFLRAYYYQYLVRTFGGVILVGDKVFGKDDIINLPRNSFADCVNYIVSECDAAAQLLPLDQLSQDFGRATKGACLALKSRILTTAASPLFNGTAYSPATTAAQAPLVGYGSYDVNRWKLAAQASLDVINMNKYSLTIDNLTAPGYGFYSTFLSRLSNEIIFEFTQVPNRDFENQFLPPSRFGNYNLQPSQNLVDAFDMANGKPITDATSGYDPNNPYVGRDPRFAYTIIYNGANYLTNGGVQTPVYTYNNAPTDGLGKATTTGYYARKMCDAGVTGSIGTTPRGYALIRYAEILLNYAEASNEAGDMQSAVNTMIQLRQRAGIQPGPGSLYGVPTTSQSDLREFIRKERRIEMAFEDMRFYDIRRWKIAESIQNGYNKIMVITPKNASVITAKGTDYNYSIQPSIRKHVFFNANYLLPIPLSEVLKIPSMVQNPGY